MTLCGLSCHKLLRSSRWRALCKAHRGTVPFRSPVQRRALHHVQIVDRRAFGNQLRYLFRSATDRTRDPSVICCCNVARKNAEHLIAQRVSAERLKTSVFASSVHFECSPVACISTTASMRRYHLHLRAIALRKPVAALSSRRRWLSSFYTWSCLATCNASLRPEPSLALARWRGSLPAYVCGSCSRPAGLLIETLVAVRRRVLPSVLELFSRRHESGSRVEEHWL